jgi:FdhD protein
MAAGVIHPITRELAVEKPVAFEVNGLGYAVMLATPQDLEDFAFGFALAEGLVGSAQEMLDLAVATVEGGYIVRLQVPAERAVRLAERIRLRTAEGSCGLCGLESIEEVLRPAPAAVQPPCVSPGAVSAALAALADHQPLSRLTGGTHAAAFCSAEGAIQVAREDVGRHNALDKLVGALMRGSIVPAQGFILLSARCSYELVDKTLRAGCAMLVTISAPTSLAAERARGAGLTLLALARPDSALVISDPHKMFGQ